MDVRAGLLLLFLLGANWRCDARQLDKPSLSEMHLRYEKQDCKIQKDATDNICTLCEQYAGQALDYLRHNQTQNEILEILHQSCSQLRSLEQKCLSLVDYYAPLLFLEASMIQPMEFCRKVNLCQQIVLISRQLREDSCVLCHRVISEVLTKLKDPDTQLEIIEVLLKACKSTKDFEKKCKRMVFEYGPLILANAEQFLETKDICTLLHACDSPTVNSLEGEEKLHSDS
ncbi:proactivator polypeptide-like 1 [Morus notabilis]|uniref:proactivator polypeptide-like 1 n=1 Tax=Morus notabilis TaxID=981085 RepID=UPI000CED07FA|nr:proactivator polypeptide-like 1 [Morus notabilis]